MMIYVLSSSLRLNVFIDDSTVAIIAVPAYNATEEKLALPRFEMLFPIDAVAVFLLLLVNRAMAVTYRSN